ncbi:hypothetical protein DFAR_1730004 [Desulfarculales bacterium]
MNFIAAHNGSLYGWETLESLMGLDNVYFDISYLIGLWAPETLAGIIRQKGPERVIYGSDALGRDATAFRQWFEDLPLTPQTSASRLPPAPCFPCWARAETRPRQTLASQ